MSFNWKHWAGLLAVALVAGIILNWAGKKFPAVGKLTGYN